MAEIITGDTTKGIKTVGELALRISRFDSYRLFTLYENVKERKVMDVSGSQKYYLVFRSPNKEIRIPEYDPKGFFEVDKVNGCILFKITKKNAEDILGMKTAGEKIFHIIRVYEETDGYGKVLSVTDEVEVYHGKWGDDEAFTTFTTENKVDLLTKSLAAQVDKNATQLTEYKELLEKYNEEVSKNSELEKEKETLRAERDSLQTQLNDYLGDTYDGTVLSTDTKYIAFEDTLENVTFTEEQYQKALGELMTKGEVDFTDFETEDDIDEPKMNLGVTVNDNEYNIEISIYKDGGNERIGRAVYGANCNVLNNTIEDGTYYVFEHSMGNVKDIVTTKIEGSDIITTTTSMYMYLYFDDITGGLLKNCVTFTDISEDGSNRIKLGDIGNSITATINLNDLEESDGSEDIYAIGVIGKLRCVVKSETTTVTKSTMN